MEEIDIKKYYPGTHYYQVKQLMQEIRVKIKDLRNRGICFYMNESVLLASASNSENSKKLTPSFFPSNNGILSLFLIPIVNTESKIGFVDNKCNIVVEPIYDEIKGSFLSDDSIVAVCKDKMWNVIDSKGHELLKNWTCGDIIPSKDSRMITINTSNSKVVLNVDAPKFRRCFKEKEISFIGEFRYGFAKIHKSNRWGIIDKDGNEVVPTIYKDMCDFHNYPCPTTQVKICEDDNWSIINLNEQRGK